jgi:hypothetical protein
MFIGTKNSRRCKLRLPMYEARTQRTITICFLSYCIFFLALCVPLVSAQGNADEKPSSRSLLWAPPNVNASLPSISAVPPCDVAKVLEAAGVHATELNTNLENFSAEERIQYQMLDQYGFTERSDESVFDYVFGFEQQGGVRNSREYRTPAKGGHNFPASGQDVGQVALALIFLPRIQPDYDMSCEGLDKSNGQLAWVIHFQQRKDKPRRTLAFNIGGATYPAMLKGRAWISMENSQILRLQTSLMKDIPAMNLESGAISVEYAPVQIQSRSVELWLPGRIEAYWQILSHRIILYHTFTNFKLFTVDTQQNIEKPKQ